MSAHIAPRVLKPISHRRAVDVPSSVSEKTNAQKLYSPEMGEDDSAELGTDSKSMTLVLLSYNRGSERVRDDLRMLRSLGEKERSFWIMFENADKLDQQFQSESKHYVPKFFAATIVGENPSVFGLKIKPLSQL
jgi:hypothetical protein